MTSEERDGPRDECGVFGIYAPERDVSRLAYFALYALQHRGQESAGIAAVDRGGHVMTQRDLGLVSQVFDEQSLRALGGDLAVGHVRYSTTGAPAPENAQPLLASARRGPIAVAHNGNLTNTLQLRRELQQDGALFQTTTDSEVILHLIARNDGEIEAAIADAAGRLQGAYALVLLTRDKLIGLRDPLGIRPLCLGQIHGEWMLASESCAFFAVGGRLVRDIRPGEMVVIDSGGVRSRQVMPSARSAFCVFEFIYFARPDSVIDGKTVHLVRKEIGRVLAREAPVEADVVIAAPDSATSAALGYAEATKIPLELGLVRNRYVGRTFIRPRAAERHLGVQIKLSPVREVLEGKRVVLVDDSIVRATTSARAVEMLREAGAVEVHVRIASPPFAHPCHYGIAVPTQDELVASHRTAAEVCRVIGADSLHYVSFAGLYQAVGRSAESLCTACFSGRYPIPIPDEDAVRALLSGRG
ncbi:MAG TPA: amidophosphoribosyltransferase [Limnochordia bacterium]